MPKMFNQSASMNVCVLMSMLCLAAGNASAQLVTNGSFENTAAGPVMSNGVDGWVLEVAESVSPLPDFEIVDDMAQEGNHALKIVIHALGSNPWDVQVIGDSIPVMPGETYRYSIWARTENPGSQVNFTVGNYAFNEYGVIRPATLSGEWQEFTFEFTISDQQTLARAPMHFSLSANIGGTIYIDNLRIEVSGAGEVWEGPPLASESSKFLGSAYSPPQTPGFAAYWNQVTPENAGKWGSVERTRDVMNWGSLDDAYRFAKNNGFPFRFHVLIWGNQQPGWIESLPANEQLEEIEEWFAAVADRYPDIDYLEVVNEPLHDPPDGPGDGNYMDALGGSNDLYGTGWDWIIKSFELARQYFPDSVKLMLNDYSIVNSDNSTTDYLGIIDLLMDRGLVDGIGVQGHAFSTRLASETTMTNNLDRLAETGLPIQICELDIDGLEDQVQLDEYRRVFPTLWEHPAVEGITLWGWRPGLWRQEQGAYLIDEDGDERPALEWLRTYLLSPISLPSRPVLISPDIVSDVPRDAVLLWHAAASATSYHVQVATNSVFATIVVDTTVVDTTLHLSPLEANTRYYWRVSGENTTGTSGYSDFARFTTGDQITSVGQSGSIPTEYTLFQNYPNPFNPVTQIAYAVPQAGYVSLRVHNMRGQEVTTIFEGVRPPGNYVVSFDGTELASGVYLYVLKASSVVKTKKFVLLK